MVVNDLERINKEIAAKLSEAKKAAKIATEKENKLSQNLKPKLAQAIEHQKTLFNNFDQIKQDTQLLPMIFKAEADLRKRAIEEKKEAESKSKIAVDQMNQLQQRIENLEKDKAKAKALSMKAIAARSNIKEYLDEEKARNGALQN